jgi:hypothetical protein
MTTYRFAFFLFACCGLYSCANIIPPGGGAIDSLPPKLVMALPKDSSVNVSPKKIELNFDEYVVLDNWYSNLIISPARWNPILLTCSISVMPSKM